MQQVLFNIPFTRGWFDNPDGVPVYGFGAMLFLTFVLAALVWGPRRTRQVGLSRDRLQDMAIVLFVAGIAGARVVYMIQYKEQFEGKELVWEFFKIWNGGIVFYGSVIGGTFGYVAFYYLVLKRLKISTWKLADAVAPLIAFGLAVGRIGCYLNGCCWGQPVCEQCQPVPLSPELGQFPLLPAHAREQVVRPAGDTDRMPEIRGLQTSTGFSVLPTARAGGYDDPRAVVAAVEPGSAAEKAGLKAGDKIVELNGQPNYIVLELHGKEAEVREAMAALGKAGGADLGAKPLAGPPGVTTDAWVGRVGYTDPKAAADGKQSLGPGGPTAYTSDLLWLTVSDWPRGDGELRLKVERDGAAVPDVIRFTPRTVPFFPTQLYESVSMVLLIFLLLAYQPFRRHDGQLLVLLMVGYAAHRFLNEAIRIEPTYALNLTLSQWISVAIFAFAVGLEVYLRRTQPRLPAGPVPLSHGAPVPPPAAVKPA